MVRIIVDSGATKARWLIKRKRGKSQLIETEGINPYFYTEEEAVNIIKNELELKAPFLKDYEVEEVIFYGAGCSTEQRCLLMDRVLQSVFPRARIIVHHDILGAARGILKDKPGYVVIIGTGSNTCYYNGKEIVARHGGLGYILNDEGSGADIGKHLIAAWLDKEMPADLVPAFEEFIGMTEAEVIFKVYQDKRPARFLAQQTLFVSEHIDHSWCRQLTKSRFKTLVTRHLKPLIEKVGKEDSVHASGSVAYHFQDIWKEVLSEEGLKAGKIVINPLDGLAEFHWGKK
ncbi:MAG: hypothetical protein GXO48_02550 [Chlorobi bacterium]|nr:hypothetical protein [Chlorobiota bacterium]